MKARSLVPVVLVAASVVVLAPQPALACSCAQGSDEQHFAAASLVFTGVAVSVEPGENEPSTPMGSLMVWTFDVEQVQKGTIGDHHDVATSGSSNSCGFEFDVGGRYQVFASAGVPSSTSLCSGTRLLAGTTLPYEPAPPTALIVGAVLGAALLAWSFRRVKGLRVPLDPGPRAPMD